ncbi:lymphocyte-specific protein 1 isoform X2 [Tachyglossus aculeatus]|uniref:lymphocyte-specific protein 1 isoform X2 n=1 Tax=Tachyglossus aculeatus TaxID=9261 RepID=UPI0018F3784D|nr:lymphocyte-specific protein 1 isoform X2 [Tachyglossus aculeatus]
MTSAVLRRSSSKQGLEHLLRLTNQWSVEDEEEAARERRRRRREEQLRAMGDDGAGAPGGGPEERLPAAGDGGAGASSGGSEEQLRDASDGGTGAPSGELQEQLRATGGGGRRTGAPSGHPEPAGGEEEVEEEEDGESGAHEREELLKPAGPPEVEEDEGFGDWTQKLELRKQRRTAPEGGPDGLQAGPGPAEEDGWGASPPKSHHDGVPRSPQPSYEEEEGDRGLLEAKLDQLSVERDWNPRRWEQAGSEGGPEEGASLLQDHEAEPMDEPQRFSEDPREAEKPLTARSPGGHGGSGSSPPPLSPTTKLTDGVHSPTRSATNSVKKASSAPPVSRIDDHLERYAHAIESSIKAPRVTRQPSIELPSMAVANTKSLWETGEVSANTPGRAAPCKDIVAGDMSKRSLWEQKGSSRPAATVKSTPSGKRYKFVLTGHGKYEKVLADEEAAP